MGPDQAPPPSAISPQKVTGVTGEATEQFSEARARKLELPIFDGEDLKSWLLEVSRYFDFNGISESERIAAVAVCLEGSILAWFRWEQRRQPFHSWIGFQMILLENF